MQVWIADSGSTKTEWTFLVDGLPVKSVFTEGINPNQADASDIASMLDQTDLKGKSPDKIFFYGSGCGSERGKSVLKDALQRCFPSAKTEIESDLIGSARALCNGTKGIVAILGTGASSCIYDRDRIINQRPSLGFILGDEGSGAVMGKLLIRKLLYSELSPEVEKDFYEEFPLTRDSIIRRIYRESYPNRFLAAFGPFIGKHRNNGSVNEVIRESFNGFIRAHLIHYPDSKSLPIYVTGSIGYHFREELNGLLRWNGFHEAICEQSPMEGLIRYHS